MIKINLKLLSGEENANQTSSSSYSKKQRNSNDIPNEVYLASSSSQSDIQEQNLEIVVSSQDQDNQCILINDGEVSLGLKFLF